jgi:hypothetical protein
LQCCSSTRRAGASPRGDIGLVGDGCCCCSAVVLVVLVLLLAEAPAWLAIGCCSAVVLVALVLLLAETSAWLARQSKSTDGQRRGTQESTASRTPAVRFCRWSFRPKEAVELVFSLYTRCDARCCVLTGTSPHPGTAVMFCVVVTPERSQGAPQRGLVRRGHCRRLKSHKCVAWLRSSVQPRLNT